MHRTDQPTPEMFLAAFDKIDQLAPAPRTLSRVLQLLRQPDSGVHKIAELINCDASLSAELLRCANSAYYSRGLRVAVVDEAVQVIGFHETIRIVSLIAIRQTAHRDLASYGLAAEDFWAECLFNGLVLEALARRSPGVDPGEAYTAGLLRFIGRLAIDQAIETLGFGLFWDPGMPLAEWERTNVGLTQAQVGSRLLRRWDFPEQTIGAVENQDADKAGAAAGGLGAAVQFISRVLPAGRAVEPVEPLIASLDETIAQHPFAQEARLSQGVIAGCLEEAHAALVSIRDTLYR